MGPLFSKADFIKFEMEFYSKSEFSMNFTTPYDYLGLYESVFPMSRKMKDRVLFLLDISFTIPELMFNSAEEIFFGCMLFAHEENGIQRCWILSQSFSQEESKKV